MSRISLTAITLGLLANIGFAADQPPSLELLLLGEKPTRLHIRVEVDGKPVEKFWDSAFAALLEFRDRNRDGKLDQFEARGLPTAFAIRQIAWGRFLPPPGESPKFADLDQNSDGSVDLAELMAYYRRAGLGGVLVGVGRPAGSQKILTDAILKQIDIDRDGKTSAAEWAKAEGAFAKLDTNDDELITANELVPQITTYPGSRGTALRLPPTSTSRGDAITDAVPIVILSPKVDPEAVSKQAGLSVGATKAILGSAPAAVWQVRLGTRPENAAMLEVAGSSPPSQPRLISVDPQARFDLVAEEGKLPQQAAESRKSLEELMEGFDGNMDGKLSPQELKQAGTEAVRTLAIAADRDGDGTLTRAELAAWLEVQAKFAKAHTLLSIVDRGSGLFEALDADRNGALSVRELRTAWNRLTENKLTKENHFDSSKLPRTLLATLSRGHADTPLGTLVQPGPKWFRAMDRNGDGDVSRREFTGDSAIFDKLDLDKDGLLSPAEAAKAGR